MPVKAIICILLAVGASAQQMGHYLQGASGLGFAAPLPPGAYVTYFPYLSRVTSVKGPRTRSDIFVVNLTYLGTLR